MTKSSNKAPKKIMNEIKEDTLKASITEKIGTVEDRQQAIASALSEARKAAKNKSNS